MIPAEKVMLYKLWFCPGDIMAPAWWKQLGLEQWQTVYSETPSARKSLNALLRNRAGHVGPIPPAGKVASELLGNIEHLYPRTLALGLWGLGRPDIMLLKPYREVLKAWLGYEQLDQLTLLIPHSEYQMYPEPEQFLQDAENTRATLLEHSGDTMLRAVRLMLPPPNATLPCPDIQAVSVILKLLRWL